MFSKKCMVLLISDLLFENWDKALQVLAGSGCESYLLHVLSPEELNPTFSGELTLTDIETLNEAPCHIGAKEISIYNYELESFLSKVKEKSLKNNIGHFIVSSDTEINELFHTILQGGGLIC